MKKNKTIKAWVTEHHNDIYVKNAHKDGYRSRAAYKLLEINEEENLLGGVKTVIDLGCAPGSWLQVLNKNLDAARIIGVDLLEIEPVANIEFIQGDFTDNSIIDTILNKLNGATIDLIVSDMAPNMSGIRHVDQTRSIYLVELVLDFAKHYLKPNGHTLIKVFHGGDFKGVVEEAKTIFTQVTIKKPNSSRSRSSEVFLLCKNKRN